MIWFVLVLWDMNYYWSFNSKSSLYIYITYIGFRLMLWLINHCRLFNSKSSLYIYIKYIWLGLVGIYSISIILGYLMLNPFYSYILNIWFLNEPEPIFCSQLNRFTYFYLNRIIVLTINNLFAHVNILKYFYFTLSIKHQSFVYTQLNDQTSILNTSV